MLAPDQQNNSSTEPVLLVKNTSKRLIKVLSVVVLITLFVGGAVILAREALFPATVVSIFGKDKLVETKTLPIPPDVLTNKVFYEWRGGAKGRVIAKDATTFTLEREGSTLKVFYEGQSLTQIWDRVEKRKISLQELEIGSEMVGEVWLFKDDKNYVGGFFNVQRPSN